ncbi:MAG: glycoside hydrolase family 16 protein, partial [Bacteroidota bacterium]|nr:glycoside hydrolase family 16 protein [Bacteroidota bacterium]MDX5429959.1 glycoside hydrolase family 16 protein [Bacteroidota bacterium]MDX5468732.1 glycoside hydrolase family 16 protein [Bacteroidota bacterium]
MKKFNLNRVVKFVPILLVVIGFTQCSKEAGPAQPNRSYELVWSDEFTGDSGSSIDPAKWNFDLGTGTNGWGNNELQTYTDQTENITLDGKGNLVISARKSGSTYTSARINTQGLFSHQYGRVEARIKTPGGQGIWPAFWMLGEQFDSVGWPQCGEIDIMEQKGQYPFISYGSLHGPSYFAGNAITNSFRLEEGSFNDDFYVYAVEWGENYVDFFVNGTLYKSVRANLLRGEWVYNQPFFLIMNVAVGGTFPGSPNAKTEFPASMFVDYVRVYKEK